MTNDTIDISQPFDTPQKLLRIIDNGDGTYSIATSGNTKQDEAWFDSILVSYTDATKAVISKVEWKLGAAVVKTLTPTFGATSDNWVKS